VSQDELLTAALVFADCVIRCFAVGDQAYLAILAETRLMKMAGMPAMPEMPEPAAGIPLPTPRQWRCFPVNRSVF